MPGPTEKVTAILSVATKAYDVQYIFGNISRMSRNRIWIMYSCIPSDTQNAHLEHSIAHDVRVLIARLQAVHTRPPAGISLTVSEEVETGFDDSNDIRRLLFMVQEKEWCGYCHDVAIKNLSGKEPSTAAGNLPALALAKQSTTIHMRLALHPLDTGELSRL